jgi:hypothetical protein
MAEVTFTKQMRSATREIHAISDALVNAKLAFGELFVAVYIKMFPLLVIILDSFIMYH